MDITQDLSMFGRTIAALISESKFLIESGKIVVNKENVISRYVRCNYNNGYFHCSPVQAVFAVTIIRATIDNYLNRGQNIGFRDFEPSKNLQQYWSDIKLNDFSRDRVSIVNGYYIETAVIRKDFVLGNYDACLDKNPLLVKNNIYVLCSSIINMRNFYEQLQHYSNAIDYQDTFNM